MFNRCFEVSLVKGIDIGAWGGEERDLERERERERERCFLSEERESFTRMRRENVFGCYIDLW